MTTKVVASYAVAALALLVAVFLAYTLAQMPIVQPEVVTYVALKEVGGNDGTRAGIGFLAFGAGVVAIIAMSFGFHTSQGTRQY